MIIDSTEIKFVLYQSVKNIVIDMVWILTQAFSGLI